MALYYRVAVADTLKGLRAARHFGLISILGLALAVDGLTSASYQRYQKIGRLSFKLDQETQATYQGVDVRTIRRHLKPLLDHRILRRKRRGQKGEGASRYWINDRICRQLWERWEEARQNGTPSRSAQRMNGHAIAVVTRMSGDPEGKSNGHTRANSTGHTRMSGCRMSGRDISPSERDRNAPKKRSVLFSGGMKKGLSLDDSSPVRCAARVSSNKSDGTIPRNDRERDFLAHVRARFGQDNPGISPATATVLAAYRTARQRHDPAFIFEVLSLYLDQDRDLFSSLSFLKLCKSEARRQAEYAANEGKPIDENDYY